MKVIKLNPEDSEIKWKKVFTTEKPIEAEIVAGSLENQGINVVAFNKRDSSYTTFGEVELFVPDTEYELALSLIPGINF